MKKLILLFSLIFGFTIYAQNIDFQSKLKEGVISIEEVRKLTDPIVQLSEKPLRFLGAKEFPEYHTLIVQYIPANMSDEDWKNDVEKKYEDYAVVFQFNYINVGENVNLEKEGVKTYFFNHVRGKYLSLFGFWKEYFDDNANREEYSTKYNVSKGKHTFRISQSSSGICYIR